MSITTMGITINGKHSYTDFGLYLADRDVTLPEMQPVRATIPYMSGYYDFSALYGGPYYGSRTLTYTFDLLADTPEAVETLVNSLTSWAMTAQESRIYDDYDPDNYFVGSYSSAKFTPDSDLPEYGGELELAFVAQPYRYNVDTDEGGDLIVPCNHL